MPLPLSTEAPVCNTSCRVSGSLRVGIRPSTGSTSQGVPHSFGTRLCTYCSSWDLLVPGSPHSRMLQSRELAPPRVAVLSSPAEELKQDSWIDGQTGLSTHLRWVVERAELSEQMDGEGIGRGGGSGATGPAWGKRVSRGWR